MKAAKHYKRQWEETNFLRLMHFTEQIFKLISFSTKKLSIALSIFSYIAFQTFLFAFRLLKLSFLNEIKIRPERDEQWIFRQIK